MPWSRRVPGRPGEHERPHARGGADGKLGRDLRTERVRDQERLWLHEPRERISHLVHGDALEIDGAGSPQQRLQMGEVAVAETETVDEHGHPASLLRSASTDSRTQHAARWSFTTPQACWAA